MASGAAGATATLSAGSPRAEALGAPRPGRAAPGRSSGGAVGRSASWLKATSFSAEGGGQWGNFNISDFPQEDSGKFWWILTLAYPKPDC